VYNIGSRPFQTILLHLLLLRLVSLGFIEGVLIKGLEEMKQRREGIRKAGCRGYS
jgi:hypothetical protein